MSNSQTARCPKCGFSSGWDGTRCRHCNHGMWDSPKAEWLASRDGPQMLLRVPREQFNPRKHLLLACGCLRYQVEHSGDASARSDPELFSPASNLPDWLTGAESAADGNPSIREAYSSSVPGQKAHWWVPPETLARVVRDLFVYPLEPDPFRDDWLTTTVVALAEVIDAGGRSRTCRSSVTPSKTPVARTNKYCGTAVTSRATSEGVGFSIRSCGAGPGAGVTCTGRPLARARRRFRRRRSATFSARG